MASDRAEFDAMDVDGSDNVDKVRRSPYTGHPAEWQAACGRVLLAGGSAVAGMGVRAGSVAGMGVRTAGSVGKGLGCMAQCNSSHWAD